MSRRRELVYARAIWWRKWLPEFGLGKSVPCLNFRPLNILIAHMGARARQPIWLAAPVGSCSLSSRRSTCLAGRNKGEETKS